MTPPPRLTSIAAAAAVLLLTAGCSTLETQVHPQPGEITVSSANYVTTSVNDLEKSFKEADMVNPKPAPLRPLSQPQYYLFAQGEFFQSDISYDDICLKITPVLAERGYLQATSASKMGQNPDGRIDLVLRVHAGERPWRDPIVRDDYLTWDDGLVPKNTWENTDPSGNSTAWDVRAGGDDASLSSVELAISQQQLNSEAATASALGGMLGGGGGRGGRMGGGANSTAIASLNDPNNPLSGLSSDLTRMPTQDFFIIVIEAYDFKDVQKNHGGAKRLWTTFMAVPKNGDQKFSQVLPALLKAGEPYFGETTSGLVVYQPGHVEIGTPYEVKTPTAQPSGGGNP